MSSFPEVDFEDLRWGRYELLEEPLLVACESRERLEDFVRQQGLWGRAVVRVPSRGWEEFRGQGKVLLLLGGDGERLDARALGAARDWAGWEEWSFTVPPEHWDMEEAERLDAEREGRAMRRKDRAWTVGTWAAAALCAAGCWAAAGAGEGLAAVVFFVAAAGWLAAGLVTV